MNKKTPWLLVSLIAQIIFTKSYGQISVTTTDIPSVCYNDGMLIVHATGGAGPYTDSILSGPSNPNLTYPIALPGGRDTFTDLPHGTFTIRVHDAAGHSGTYTASVGGTYEFPLDTLYQPTYYGPNGIANRDTVICPVQTGTGLAPFGYAISPAGANTGFGPYQPQNYFGGLCPGNYWIRLRDSCGNIFTNTITVSYSIYLYLNCIDFDSGSASVQALGGTGQYTYSVYDINRHLLATDTSGNFTGLPTNVPFSGYVFDVTDACGQTYAMTLFPETPTYEVGCPFDGNITLTGITSTDNFYLSPYVFTCLNCSPVQTVTMPYPSFPDTIFTGLNVNTAYYIQMNYGCGNMRVDTFTTTPSLITQIRYTSCRGFDVYFSYPNGDTVPAADIDSVQLFDGVQWLTNSNGVFNHLRILPAQPTYDTIIGYINGGCVAKLTTSLNMPLMGVCGIMHQDSSCSKVWNLIAALPPADYPEKYSIINSANDTTAEQPPGGGNGAYFYALYPGSYTMISDSGCSIPVYLDTFTHIRNAITGYMNCLGQPVAQEAAYDTFYQNNSPVPGYVYDCSPPYQFSIKFFRHDSLVAGPDSLYYNSPPVTLYLPDTGYYTYKIYNIEYGLSYWDSIAVYDVALSTVYDTLCPADTGSFYVSGSTVPFPYVQTAYKCNGVSSGPPMLTIYGGALPYTVQIPGLDTMIMNTNTAVFPTDSIGTYSVIAYDNCGISRSFTFSIQDTCTGCGTVSAGDDTAICQGTNAYLAALAQVRTGSYSWAPGGATTRGITVSPATTTTYMVTYTKSGCTPVSNSVTVTVTSPPTVSARDTETCADQPVTLTAIPSVPGGAYIWEPGGGTSPTVTVSPSSTATYTVTYSLLGCSAIASAVVTVIQPPSLTSGNASVCEGQSANLTATASQAGGVYTWWPGGATTQSISVSPAVTTTYEVSYAIPLSVCPAVTAADTAFVTLVPSVSVPDTTICAGLNLMLTAVSSQAGGTYVWSPGGAMTQSITISPAVTTTYSVTYLLSPCPAVSGSGTVTTTAPPAVSVSVQNPVCTDTGGALWAIVSGGTVPYSYLWSDASNTVTDTLTRPYAGSIYTVTVTDHSHCTAQATGIPGTDTLPLAIDDTVSDITCHGLQNGFITVTVADCGGCAFQWDNGSAGATLTGLAAGTYSVTVSSAAGCTGAMSFNIHEPPPATLTIAPADTQLAEGSDVIFDPVFGPYPVSDIVSYIWSPAAGLSCSDCPQPVFSSDAGNYTYIVVISYNQGCHIADTVNVIVFSRHLIYIPNSFTPNGDGINDVFQAFPVDGKYFNLKIFDRWGEKVFESQDQGTGWNGTYQGAGEPAGIYTYELDVTFDDGCAVHNKGSITLLK